MNLAAGIISTANALGINPVDLGTVISYETGGTFDPLQLGPTTRFGQHQGLIQFGEPQASQFGVSFETPQQAFYTQLGPNAGIYNYLKNAGVKPGMGLTQLYSAINTGGVNNLFMTDEASGGMPGTVLDKVASMEPHRKKAMELLKMNQDGQTGPLNANPLLGDINTGIPEAMTSPAMGDQSGLFGYFGKAVGGGFKKVKEALTGEDRDASDRLAVALMSLSGNPTALQPLMQLAAQDIQDRKTMKIANDQKNATIGFLTAEAQKGDAKAQNALKLVDALGAAGAMEQYLASTNPSQASNKTEADTINYPNGFREQQFQDGSIRYFLNNTEVTDPAEITKLRNEGQEMELDLARREEIEKGAGTAQSNLLKDTMDSMINTNSSLKSFEVAKDALRRAIAENKNVTGFFTQYFPNVSLEAQELEFAATSLGLDVIGSVTFGALSKGELDLALSKEMPLGLGERELLEYIERRESALKKYQFELRKAAKYLQNSDNTIEGYIDNILSKQEVVNNYTETSDDELERLFREVKSGTSNLVPEKRQMIIDEVKRRANL